MEIKSKAHTFKHGQEHILRIDKLSILDIISFKYISKTCGQTKHQKEKPTLWSLVRNSAINTSSDQEETHNVRLTDQW